MKTLYLGSKSRSRQDLLRQAGIPFVLADADCDEKACDWGMPLEQLVKTIALAKMEHVVLPSSAREGEEIFVLTADTLGINSEGRICGKPADKEDAIAMLKTYRTGVRTGTGFCLDKRVWRAGAWEIAERIVRYVDATYIFDVPDACIDYYFDNLPLLNNGCTYMDLSGAVAIEGVGMSFTGSIHGSYTAIAGLPLFELRQALQVLGFFS